MIPADLLSQLRDAVARWDASNTDAEQHDSGKELAAVAFRVLLWDQSQGAAS